LKVHQVNRELYQIKEMFRRNVTLKAVITVLEKYCCISCSTRHVQTTCKGLSSSSKNVLVWFYCHNCYYSYREKAMYVSL